MVKVDELFNETFKAIDIAKNIEDKAMKEIPYPKQLEMLKSSMHKARSREEYEEYEKKIESLELDMKFNPVYHELSKDERDAIQHNFKVESKQANKIYNDKKKEVIKEYDKAMKKIIPLIDEMNAINNKVINARYVEDLLDGNVYSRPTNNGVKVLGPALRLYPDRKAGYTGTLADLKLFLSLAGKALKSPNSYRTNQNRSGSVTIYRHI